MAKTNCLGRICWYLTKKKGATFLLMIKCSKIKLNRKQAVILKKKKFKHQYLCFHKYSIVPKLQLICHSSTIHHHHFRHYLLSHYYYCYSRQYCYCKCQCHILFAKIDRRYERLNIEVNNILFLKQQSNIFACCYIVFAATTLIN